MAGYSRGGNDSAGGGEDLLHAAAMMTGDCPDFVDAG